MISLSVTHLSKAFGEHVVLKDVCFTVQKGDRIGLVGVNGSGKTTLLRILAGLEEADEGEVSVEKDASIGYLAQQNTVAENATVWELLKETYRDAFQTERRLRELESEISALHEDPVQFARLSSEYDRLTRQFEEMDGYSWESRITGVLNGLGFSPDQYGRPVQSLSGGEITRLCLGRLLLKKNDILLLDEPTNHLDMASLSWLESALASYPGTVLLVSHDRYFLDRVCNGMVELIGGVSEQYPGNYSRYALLRQERFESRMRAYEMQQKEVARQKAIIARYRMYNREKSIRAAESREKALNRMDLLSRPEEEQGIRLSFTAGKRTGDDVLLIDDLSKSYDRKKLFQHFSLHVRIGDRIAVIGPNGIGKTTLLRMIVGEETPDSGTIRKGANVQIGYYDQQQAGLHPDKTVLDEIWDRFPQMEQYRVRGALGMFLFVEDDVFQPIRTLSGGEKGRVALTALMLQHDNVLILDEPTNHLDMDSREALEDALSGYNGTILTVSHDRYFINRVADHILEVTENGAVMYLGNYDEYIEKKNAPAEQTETSSLNRTQMDKLKKRDRESRLAERARRQRISETEQQITEIESQMRSLEDSLADPKLYSNPERAAEARNAYREAEQSLGRLYALWEELEAEGSSAQS